MEIQNRLGRPKVSSRETLSEAACELFLEKGYELTSVSDITTRAGVSRSSFFNYFAVKSDVIWSSFDERIENMGARLAEATGDRVRDDIRSAVDSLARDFAPDALALALSNAAAMEAEGELEREGALRMARIGTLISARFARAGESELHAAILGAAYAGAVWAATREWAREGSARSPLAERMHDAMRAVDDLTM